jgi:hypothetical protein
MTRKGQGTESGSGHGNFLCLGTLHCACSPPCLAPFFFRSFFYSLLPPSAAPKSPQPLQKLTLELGDGVGVEDQVFLQAVGGDVEGGPGR